MQAARHDRRTLLRAVCRWDPAPIPAPGIDPQVGRRAALERAAEVLRYRLHALEYALFPEGELRAWMRICLRICLMLALPTLFILPALVALATGLADVTAAGARICRSLLEIVVYIVSTAFILLALAKVVTSRRGQA